MGSHLPSSAVLAWVLAITLSGCAGLAPPPEPASDATLPVPAAWAASPSAGTFGVTADAMPDWRALIQDERLARLIELALANNRDLRLATLNIDAARARYGITQANRWPAVNASAVGSTSRGAAEADKPVEVARQWNVSLGVTAWELDLWGRLASLKDAARASYLASEQTQRAVQASLVAELAQAWLTLAADQQLEQLARQTLDSRLQGLALIEKRKALGAASALDLAIAQAAVETVRGDLASTRVQLVQDRNTLRLLVGVEPPAAWLPNGAVADSAASDSTQANGLAAEADHAAALPAVPADLPSTVLLRRPDVRAAELNLQAARADVAAARAALFPTLTLTGSAGAASTGLAGLWSGGSGTWSFVPVVKLPIFDGGASRAALDGAQAAGQIQQAAYEKAIQQAFKEVADALAVRAGLAERLQSQQRLVAAYDSGLRLTTQRWRAGAESALAVLDAQRSLFGAQQALISLRLADQRNRLALFKALGGI